MVNFARRLRWNLLRIVALAVCGVLALVLAVGLATPAWAMQGWLLMPDQSRQVLELEAGDSVDHVKAVIQDHFGYDPQNFYLTFNGTVMSDQRTLSDYNFHRDDTLALNFNAVAPHWLHGTPTFVCGQAFDQHFDYEVLGVQAAVVSGPLPAGLVFDGVAGRLYGTPTQPGNFRFTIRASNDGSFAQTSFSATVSCDLANTGTDSQAPFGLAVLLVLSGALLIGAKSRLAQR